MDPRDPFRLPRGWYRPFEPDHAPPRPPVDDPNRFLGDIQWSITVLEGATRVGSAYVSVYLIACQTTKEWILQEIATLRQQVISARNSVLAMLSQLDRMRLSPYSPFVQSYECDALIAEIEKALEGLLDELDGLYGDLDSMERDAQAIKCLRLGSEAVKDPSKHPAVVMLDMVGALGRMRIRLNELSRLKLPELRELIQISKQGYRGRCAQATLNGFVKPLRHEHAAASRLQ